MCSVPAPSRVRHGPPGAQASMLPPSTAGVPKCGASLLPAHTAQHSTQVDLSCSCLLPHTVNTCAAVALYQQQVHPCEHELLPPQSSLNLQATVLHAYVQLDLPCNQPCCSPAFLQVHAATTFALPQGSDKAVNTTPATSHPSFTSAPSQDLLPALHYSSCSSIAAT
jgi:hypothetical protein